MRTAYVPVVDRLALSQRHAQPETEQPLTCGVPRAEGQIHDHSYREARSRTERGDAALEDLEQGSLLSSFIVDEHLNVGERLPVEHEVLALSDRIVHIKVLLAEQILVKVELLQVAVPSRATRIPCCQITLLYAQGKEETDEMRPPKDESTSGWSIADWIAAGYRLAPSASPSTSIASSGTGKNSSSTWRVSSGEPNDLIGTHAHEDGSIARSARKVGTDKFD
jgi:hypothetical protein